MGRNETPAPAEPAPRNPLQRNWDAELRLGCLRAALELRAATTTADDTLATAQRFYRFCVAAGATAKD